MSTNQIRAFLLAVMGFAPGATAGFFGPMIHHSDQHYIVLFCFLGGLFGLGWFIRLYRE